MRVGVGGLLTPDGCIEEVTVPGLVTCYLPASFTAFTSPGSGIVLVWVVGGVLGWVVVLVSSVWTVWWQVCAHGGGMGCACGVVWSEASAERNPLLG